MTTKANPSFRRQDPASPSRCKPALLVEVEDWTVREALVLLIAVSAARVLRPTFTLGWIACALAGVGAHWLLTAVHLAGG